MTERNSQFSLEIGNCTLSEEGIRKVNEWSCSVRTAVELFITVHGYEFTNQELLNWLKEHSETLANEFRIPPTKGTTGGSKHSTGMKGKMSPKARSIMQMVGESLTLGGSKATDPLVEKLQTKRESSVIRRLLPNKETEIIQNNIRLLKDLADGEMLTSIERGTTRKIEINKVGRGAFNTKGDSWHNMVVQSFLQRIQLNSAIDPFAGQGDLLNLCKSEYGMSVSGLDIQEDLGWPVNDSLKSIPKNEDSVCVTNPPYLANYSAKRKSMWNMVGEYFEETGRSDLYEIALDRCLESFDYIVAIIPETFLHSSYPKERCAYISILEENPFEDTTFPVCVTCWVPESGQDTLIFLNDEEVMRFSEMVAMKGDVSRSKRVVFNDPNGNVGLRAVDGTKTGDRICFVPATEFDYPRSSIKVSSRLMTYLDIPELSTEKDIADFCTRANTVLESYRERSQDILLSGFKGNNKEGKRRRRLDYRLGRKIVLEALRVPVQTTLPLEHAG